jgi:hypothetical protein
MTKPRIDPGLEEIRRVRPEISEEIGRDPGRLLEYYKEVQKEYADRLLHSADLVKDEPRTVAG